jgi:hypothetical protein
MPPRLAHRYERPNSYIGAARCTRSGNGKLKGKLGGLIMGLVFGETEHERSKIGRFPRSHESVSIVELKSDSGGAQVEEGKC